eukprot:CAMPEP_0182918578 /NCGR_PEP_ID=MMETSP0105_2-20130417/2180_1 /TAXON_ID=81532 ORGANISM="Acanthoeca-like sp., Strain 10tr" /NCGR_SAMPLE_ID=MMETSP0105_2 /ASSEMBLY_ACC=CAM_ASM_000205 /LENGTH=60 /DNA_ID=CAMNT_0025055677 /DNA_START=72 /DNA_END=250 /DNA_ORIENTATION=+
MRRYAPSATNFVSDARIQSCRTTFLSAAGGATRLGQLMAGFGVAGCCRFFDLGMVGKTFG